MSKGKTIRAVVRDTHGRPVANARVIVETGPGPMPDIAPLTNGEGEVLICVPKTGVYGFICAADGFATTRKEIMATDDGQAVLNIVLSQKPPEPE